MRFAGALQKAGALRDRSIDLSEHPRNRAQKLPQLSETDRAAVRRQGLAVRQADGRRFLRLRALYVGAAAGLPDA